MLWMHDGDAVLFREKPSHAYLPGSWRGDKIRDEFGVYVSGRITYEGDVCAVDLPGTYVGLPAFLVRRTMMGVELSRGRDEKSGLYLRLRG